MRCRGGHAGQRGSGQQAKDSTRHGPTASRGLPCLSTFTNVPAVAWSGGGAERLTQPRGRGRHTAETAAELDEYCCWLPTDAYASFKRLHAAV